MVSCRIVFEAVATPASLQFTIVCQSCNYFANYTIFASYSFAAEEGFVAMSFDPVCTLSSDDECVEEPPVPDHAPCAPRRPKKRKAAESDTAPTSSTVRIRAMLGKPKCHCRSKCLAQFSDDSAFAELSKFRDNWLEMHKLDQDHEDTWLDTVLSTLFGNWVFAKQWSVNMNGDYNDQWWCNFADIGLLFSNDTR